MTARSFATIAKEFRALPRTGKAVAELFRDALRLARQIVPFDGWAALTLDPASALVTGGVHEHGFSAAALARFYELEYAEGDFLSFGALARELSPVGVLSEATNGELDKSARYREVLSAAGYHHELRVALRSMKQTWGGVFLLRRPNAPRFESEDESFMREFGDALAEAVRSTLRAAGAATDTRTGRAIVLLGGQLQILEASPSAPVWLEELAERPLEPGALPHTVRSTVNGARRGAEKGSQVSAYVRVRGKSGDWLTVHAGVLGDGNVVVTIEEGRSIPLPAPLRQAYDLSPLQAELLRDVLLGSEEAQIADRLNVTEVSVAKELAAVLQKVGVERRPELPKKLFFDHYYERAKASAALGPDGWFAG